MHARTQLQKGKQTSIRMADKQTDRRADGSKNWKQTSLLNIQPYSSKMASAYRTDTTTRRISDDKIVVP